MAEPKENSEKQYVCLSCNHRFNTPKSKIIEEIDDWVEECPKCGSDNFTTNEPNITS